MKAKEQLRKDVEKALDSWDERSNFTLKGVRNLSFSDLQMIEMYLDLDGQNLREPIGEIGEVFEAYGITF